MMIPVAMELEFGKVITSMLTIIHYLGLETWEDHLEEMIERFDTIIYGVSQLSVHLMRMREHLDPNEFYHGMRPYLAGSYNNPGLPNGLIYRGVSSIGKKYAGGSAAQTAMTPSMDALIPIHHHQAVKDYNMKLRDYIPYEHKLFLESLDKKPTLTELLKKRKNQILIDKFNQYIETYTEFRNKHIQIVTLFIVFPASTKAKDFQANKSPATSDEEIEKSKVPIEEIRRHRRRKLSRSHSLSDIGTGGTPFMIYLKAIRDATYAAKLTDKTADEEKPADFKSF